MNEPFDLERAASRLGQQAGDALNVEQAAEGVVRSLRQRRPWWRSHGLLQAAAALVVFVGGATMVLRMVPRESPDVAAAAANAAGVFDGLSSTELMDVLDSMALDAPPSSYVGRGLHDLTEAQLNELLKPEG